MCVGGANMIYPKGRQEPVLFVGSKQTSRVLNELNLLQIAELVATEFFDQGDKERKELNIEPTVSGRITSCKMTFGNRI